MLAAWFRHNLKQSWFKFGSNLSNISESIAIIILLLAINQNAITDLLLIEISILL